MTDLDLPPASNPTAPRRWLFAIVAVLLAAFAVVAGLQWRQYTLLHAGHEFENSNTVWMFYQLEVEFMRLRHTLHSFDAHPELLDREALQTRYDIFVSRSALIEPALTTELMEAKPIQAETVARIKTFIAETDVFLGPGAARAVDVEVARALLARLQPLTEPVHEMSRWAYDEMNALIGARSELVRDQNRTSIALMGFQLLLTILFTAVVVRQFRTLEQRGVALERLAQRLQEARSDAEAASRAKSAFLANMSHELRTPFQGVLGMLALIEDGPLNVRQSDQLRTARESALHLLALLNDVLDLSTLEHGTHKLAPAPTSLHRLLAEVESLMGGTARAKGLVLRLVRHADVPVYALADATRLKQILFNLLGNAIKFTDTGEVVLETGVETGGPQGPMLRLRITDTGIGMDKAALDRLFQRFSQGDETTSRRFGGTGLGLEISRNLARLMGGDIEVASRPGQGSSFTLRIRLLGCAPPAAESAASVSPGTRPLRVLVAEDNAINQKFIRALLARLGHRITMCENSQLALEAAAHEDFDLVLMDMHMPVMDGLAATRAIRVLPAPRGTVPIVALTADAFPETRDNAAQAGMTEFLSKPVLPADLQATLFRLFGPPAEESAQSPGPAPIRAVAAHADASGPSATHHARPVAADAPVQRPAFDASVLAQLPMVADGSEPAFEAEVLEKFRHDSARTIALCRGTLASGDTATALRGVHSLKSSSAQVGALALAALAGEMERELHGGQPLDKDRMAHLVASHQQALLAIAEHLARQTASPSMEGSGA